MIASSLDRRVAALEQKLAAESDGNLVARLARARATRHSFVPPFTHDELVEITLLSNHADPRLVRVANGLLRAELYAPPVKRRMPEVNPEQVIVDVCGALTQDPLRWVLFAFPWGEPGTDLAAFAGPRKWQRKLLDGIGQQMRSGAAERGEVIQRAVSSGNGPGKSALAAWLVLFSLATHELARVSVTASTDTQLRTKTVPEARRWFNAMLMSHWFEMTATSIAAADAPQNWRADYTPWNESRPESAAGLHNAGRRILVLFDEASAVADVVWDVARGSLTDASTEMAWVVLGNPLRADGEFARAITEQREQWRATTVDTREVEGVNQVQIAKYVAEYGLDSDFVRTRVLGLPPRTSSTQFIPKEEIVAAMLREVPDQRGHPVVVGLDPARFGDDESVIATRRGRDMRLFPLIRMKGLSVTGVVARLMSHVNLLRSAGLTVHVFVDGGGVGGGHVDVARAAGLDVIEVNFGGRALDPVRYFNRRAEMYANLKEWLATGALPDDEQMVEELAALEYGYASDGNQLQLESKADLKKRLGRSPDAADAAVLTLAAPVAMVFDEEDRSELRRRKREYETDPLAFALAELAEHRTAH